MAMQTAASAANHPLIAASGGKITPQQLEAYFQAHGSYPTWRKGPDGQPIISSSKAAKELGWTNSGTVRSVVGTAQSRAATSGQVGSGIGSVYTPGAVNKAIEGQGVGATAERSLLGELYNRADVLPMMAQAAAGTFQTPDTSGRVIAPPGSTPPLPDTRPAPPRGRGGQIPEGATSMPGQPVPIGSTGALPTTPVGSLAPGTFQTPDQFAQWFSGQGPLMSGQLGDVYGMRAPVLTADNEYLFPGMVGQTFGTGGDNALLTERVQAQQLLDARRTGEPANLYGPISPLMPPHLIQQAGYGPESVLGGQYSIGQAGAADPSLQGMINEGVMNWYGAQTPTGPYAGYQFPTHFGQPQGGATTNLPVGTGTNYTPFPGFGQPGTNPPPGGGGSAGGGGGSTGGGTGTNPFPPVTTTPPGGGGGSGAGGGGGGGTSGANPFPPISIDTGTPAGGIGTLGPDAFLADMGADVGYLRGIASNAGYATNATPAWEAMVASQQRNLNRMAAQLGEQFNVSGNRFSTSFGDAMADFYNQAGLDQNSLLAQMTLQAQEAARQRELAAAGQLGQFGYGGASQLSSQGFQALMNQMQQQYGAASQMFGASQNAAQQLLANSMTGAQGLFNAENQAALAEAQRQQQLLQLMLGTAGNLDQTWMQNLQLGGQLGMQQYTLMQDQIDRLYNEFMRTQPEYNPMIPYWFSGATGYPPSAYPQFTPPMLPSLLGGLGGLLGLAANAGIFGTPNTHAGGGTNPQT